MIGLVHAQAEIGAGGEAENRPHVGLVGGQRIGAIGVRLVTRDVVVGQSVKLVARGGDMQRAIRDVAIEVEGEVGDLVLKVVNLFARGIVLVDAGKAVFEQRVLKIVARSRIVPGSGMAASAR